MARVIEIRGVVYVEQPSENNNCDGCVGDFDEEDNCVLLPSGCHPRHTIWERGEEVDDADRMPS